MGKRLRIKRHIKERKQCKKNCIHYRETESVIKSIREDGESKTDSEKIIVS